MLSLPISELKLNENQILTDAESFDIYGKDWTSYYQPTPQAILFPKSTEEVRDIVLWARKNSISLVPSGGRTGLSGAAVATNNEVVVSLEKMNQILEWNPTNQTIHCQAGVVTEALQNFASEKEVFFPVDFASRGSSQIGGNIATNAGGIKVLRYGLMREWVAGLTVVTGTGEILKLNNDLVKNASGYDLRQLFIGSEGTLGFITEASIRVTRPPKPLHVMALGVPNLDSIMQVFTQFRQGTSLMAFEMFSGLAMKSVLDQGHVSSPFSTETPYYLIVEFEEDHSDAVENALSIFETCVENGWVEDGVLSQNETQAKELWRLREDISEATSPFTPYKNDISVTIDKVPPFIEEIDALFKKEYPEFDVVWFGHIGDGNLHINILKPEDMPKDDFLADCRRVDDLLFQTVAKFSGSISAEHGVGLTKKPFLKYTRAEAEIQLMRSIKSSFDPDQILNPGKVF